MLPNFFVIGATKAGTSSLSQYLKAHPEIHMSPIKEPHFFVQPGDGLPVVADRVASLGEYEALFESARRVRGEASTSYTHYPARRGVPERIRELIPDARFLYLVRDPIDRLVSHYRHQMAFHGERRPIEVAVGDLGRPENIYVCAGMYGTQLRRYLRVFAQDQIMVVDQRDLLGRREDTMRLVFAFLDVEADYVSAEFGREFGTGRMNRAYSPAYVRLRRRLSGQRLPGWVRSGARRALQRVERAVWSSVPEVELPEHLRAELAGIFHPETEDLRQLTGQPFDGWSV